MIRPKIVCEVSMLLGFFILSSISNWLIGCDLQNWKWKVGQIKAQLYAYLSRNYVQIHYQQHTTSGQKFDKNKSRRHRFISWYNFGRIYKLYIIRGVKNCPTMIKVCIVSQVQYIVQVG